MINNENLKGFLLDKLSSSLSPPKRGSTESHISDLLSPLPPLQSDEKIIEQNSSQYRVLGSPEDFMQIHINGESQSSLDFLKSTPIKGPLFLDTPACSQDFFYNSGGYPQIHSLSQGSHILDFIRVF